MRTTVRLDDELLKQVKTIAARSGRTLTAVIEDALRQALSPRKEAARGPADLPTFAGGGVQPGVDLDDSASLIDLMEEDTDPS